MPNSENNKHASPQVDVISFERTDQSMALYLANRLQVVVSRRVANSYTHGKDQILIRYLWENRAPVYLYMIFMGYIDHCSKRWTHWTDQLPLDIYDLFLCLSQGRRIPNLKKNLHGLYRIVAA